jgi:ubiquinone/menaquinone biosynthesis C-methylase UbiE
MEPHRSLAARVALSPTRETHARVLACPKCRSLSFGTEGELLRCADCGFEGRYKSDVYLVLDEKGASYFDELHGTMTTQNAKEGVNEVFYVQQFKYLKSIFRPGMVIADIGCGPQTTYPRPDDTLLVGIDPSFQSVVLNRDVDIRIFGGAQAIPLATASVDVVICFYSIHHMIGSTIAETRRNVCNAFEEFRRIGKPGGKVIVFEVNPYWPFWIAQRLFWCLARRLFGTAIDFFFWSRHEMKRFGEENLRASKFESQRYKADWRITFPPAFSLQWLRMPFLFYPFSVKRFSWTL